MCFLVGEDFFSGFFFALLSLLETNKRRERERKKERVGWNKKMESSHTQSKGEVVSCEKFFNLCEFILIPFDDFR